jgi:hypothetical protein
MSSIPRITFLFLFTMSILTGPAAMFARLQAIPGVGWLSTVYLDTLGAHGIVSGNAGTFLYWTVGLACAALFSAILSALVEVAIQTTRMIMSTAR